MDVVAADLRQGCRISACHMNASMCLSRKACAACIKIYYGAVFLVSIPYYLLHNQLVSILIFMRLILRDRSLDTITRIEQITDGSIVI